MNTIILFVMLGFIIGGVLGFAIGKAQPKPNPGVGLGSVLKDIGAVAAVF